MKGAMHMKDVPTGIPFLEGDRLYLRGLVEEDAYGRYPTWFNSQTVCRHNSHHVFPYTVDNALDYIRAVRNRKDALVLAIILQEGDAHIGNIALQNIDFLCLSAELSIVIGEEWAWGKRYGRDAGHLICGHGFDALNLNRIYCGTYAENIAMQHLAAQLGMRKEGCRRQAAFKRGQYVDVVEYGVLRDEYYEHVETSGRKEQVK